jgi:hypothetical protein
MTSHAQLQLFTVGTRVRLTKDVDFSDGGAAAPISIKLPEGASGSVAWAGDHLNHIITVRFDQAFPCLTDFDNSLAFDHAADGGQGVGVATDYLAMSGEG